MSRIIRHATVIVGLGLLAFAAAAQNGQSTDAIAAKPGDHITLPAGTVVSVRIADAVNSGHNHSGDLLTGIVDPSVLIENNVVIPRGTEAHVRLVEDKKGGHIKGKAEVRLELISLIMNGHQLGVESADYDKTKGGVKGKMETGAKSASSGGIDAAAAAGPGGAVVGGVIGMFSAPKIELQPNSRVEFKLSEPFLFVVPPAAAP